MHPWQATTDHGARDNGRQCTGSYADLRIAGCGLLFLRYRTLRVRCALAHRPCQDRGWSLWTTPGEPWRGVTRQVTDPSAGPQRGLPAPQPPGQRPGRPRLPRRPFHPSDHRPGPPSRRPCAQDGLKGKIVAKRYSCDSHGGGAGFGNASSDRPRIRGDGEGTGARAFHLRTAQAG